jgi:hypothetical protein
MSTKAKDRAKQSETKHTKHRGGATEPTPKRTQRWRIASNRAWKNRFRDRTRSPSPSHPKVRTTRGSVDQAAGRPIKSAPNSGPAKLWPGPKKVEKSLPERVTLENIF